MRTVQILVFCGLIASTLHATPVPACPSGETAQYYELFANGNKCSNGILNFTNFSFEAFQSSGGTPLSASQVGVTPIGTPDEAGVTGFSLTGPDGQITVQPGEDETYVFSWLFLINDSGTASGTSLTINPPAGDVTITEYFCLDSNFQNSQYNGTAPTCTTSVEGPTAQVQTLLVGTGNLTDSLTFSPALAQDYANVMTVVQLTGGEVGANVDSLSLDSQINSTTPEPGTLLLVAGAALVFGVLRKRASV